MILSPREHGKTAFLTRVARITAARLVSLVVSPIDTKDTFPPREPSPATFVLRSHTHPLA
jgi:hypothetical protein